MEQREQILNAAVQLIAEGPITMQMIGARIGARKSIVHYYFPAGKKSLIRAAYQRAARDVINPAFEGQMLAHAANDADLATSMAERWRDVEHPAKAFMLQAIP